MARLRERDVAGAPNTTRFAEHPRPEPATPLLSSTGQEARNRLGKLSRGLEGFDADQLEEFGIYYAEPIALKDGEAFERSGEHATLNADSPVFTRQLKVRTKRVEEYLTMMDNSDDIAAIQVTDIVPGGGHWHLNGLHRLVAARLLERSIQAEVWR